MSDTLLRSGRFWWLATAVLMLPATAYAQQSRPNGGRPQGGGDPRSDDIVVNGQAPPGSVIGDIPAEYRLSPADIAAYGVGTVSELLDEIAAQTQSDQGRDDSSGPVVLVNGRRISGVNEVGDLPTEAVLRIDILPEEVALRYGYDAQRKVVNVILRRRFQARVASIAGGFATEGQGQNFSAEGSYTRIRDNDRLNITARVQSAASLRESDRNIRQQTDGWTKSAVWPSDDAFYRTLIPASRNYVLNATIGHEFNRAISGSLNLRGNYTTSDALDGLPSATLSIPASNPYAVHGSARVRRFLAVDTPLRREMGSGSIAANGTLNFDLTTRWRLSLIAGYAHSEATTHGDLGFDIAMLQAAIDTGETAVDPYGDIPLGILGSMRREHSISSSDSANLSALATGKLLQLPAGDMRISLRVSGDVSAQSSETERDGTDVVRSRSLSQSNGGGQISLDLPIASRRGGFLSGLGVLTANVNAGVIHVSDYGSLDTLGYGFNWTPFTGLSFIGAVNEDRTAPSLILRNAPVVTTDNVRVYDYVRGETRLVTRIAGGNPALAADDRRVMKLGVTAKPVADLNLTLSANYINSRTRNPVGSINGVTSALESAFPDRFERDEEGGLVRVDSRSLNFAREDREQLRWGMAFSAVLRAPRRPAPPPGAPPWGPSGAGVAVRDGGADESRVTSSEPSSSPEMNEAAPAAGQEPSAGQDGDIVVNGRQDVGGSGGFMPPPPPDDFDGPPPDGPPPGPPPEGFGSPPGGPMGPGGGPGGFGGGPPGGPRGMGGGDNGVRWQFSLYHSWVFRDVVVLRAGGDVIDLLDGGTIGGNARPRHSIQMDTGVTDNGLGVRLGARWKSAAKVDGSTTGSAQGDLRFSSLLRFDLRLFANLANRFRGRAWARGTRVSVSVDNIFDTRQHVRAADGTTPLAYQAANLDPMGRTVQLTLRRIF